MESSGSSSNNVLSASAEFTRELDVADNIRATLTQFGESTKGSSLTKIFDDIPQFVVVGAQSSGKSSILSRISGIEFPTAAVRCTQAAVVLKLRRAKNKGDERPPTVTIRGTDKDEVAVNEHIGTASSDVGSIELIKKAQSRALHHAGVSEGFVETLEIEIAVTATGLPNVTLVDLPGLIAPNPNSNDPEVVERLVKRYAHMPGSLLLNVVPLEQDYDTGLGKNIVAPLMHKTTFVFTKLDILMKLGDEAAARRLEHVFRETAGAMRVVALGCIEDGSTEKEQLAALNDSHLHAYGEDCRRGKQALCNLIEDRMREHLAKQMPALHAEVKKERDTRNARLKELAPQDASKVLRDTYTQLTSDFAKGTRERQDRFRAIRETLSVEVKNCGYFSSIGTTFKPATADEIFTGAKIYAPGGFRYRMARIISFFEGQETAAVGTFDTLGVVDCIAHFKVSDLKSPIKASAAAGIRELIEKHQGLRSAGFVDPQPIVEHFAARFADEVEAKIVEANSGAVKFLREHGSSTFLGNKAAPSASTPILQWCAKQLESEIKKLIKEAAENTKRLSDYNRPPLVFTTNEHYLEDIYKKMVAENPPKTGDGMSDELIWLRWLSYRKVQVKAIVETGAKDLIRTLLVGFETAVGRILSGFFDPNLAKLIRPEDRFRRAERKRLEVDVAKLDSILQSFDEHE